MTISRSEAARLSRQALTLVPDRDCPLCPRLVAFREANRAREPLWHNAPVAPFGEIKARLLIVGLAPGMQGANRTGRPFTGDYAGDLLYATLIEYGFAKGSYQARPDDGLRLVDCRIANAVHCVPPQNKPLPVEINTCRQFLIATIAGMPNLRAIVALDTTLEYTPETFEGHRSIRQALSELQPPAIPVLLVASAERKPNIWGRRVLLPASLSSR